MPELFEIVYADGTVIAGQTVAQFRAAPDDGVQFVIVQQSDGSIIKQKALDVYEYKGAKKPGSYMPTAAFEALKGRLGDISKLLNPTITPLRRER